MTATDRQTKVARLLETYNLDGVGAELETAWTADENRRSLRELADYLNKKLLCRRLDETDRQFIDDEIDLIYRVLQDEESDHADRARIRRRLERAGVDVETLRSDFVTYQAVRTYLKNDRGAEYTRDGPGALERESENLEQLRGRIAAVTNGKIERLRDSGDLTLGEFHVLVNTRVVCEDCGSHKTVSELLGAGGCDCPE